MSITCHNCGRENPDGAQFCANPDCGLYLSWESGPTGQTPAGYTGRASVPGGVSLPATGSPGGQPSPPTGGEQRVGVRASLADAVVAVSPGGAGSTTLSVYNAGTRVEGFVAKLTGPAAQWSEVEPAELAVYPEQTATATLRFAPPRSPSCPAGHAWYVVRLDSTIHPGLTVTANGVVNVAAYHDVAAELVPATSSGRGTTKHEVVLDNRGNVVERAQLSAVDDEGTFRMNLAHTVVELRPSSTDRVRVPLSVRPPRLWFGRPRTVRIHATVSVSDAGAPIRVDATRHVKAVFPSWARVVALAALLIAGGGTAIALANSDGTPTPTVSGSKSPETSPTPSRSTSPSPSPSRTPKPGLAEVTLRGVPLGDIQAALDRVTRSGYRPVWFDGYEVGANTYLNVIFRTADATPTVARPDMTAAAYQSEFAILRAQGYRLVNITSYMNGGGVRYAAIWRKEAGPTVAEYHGLNAQDHQARFNSLTSQGYHPVNISIVSPNNQTQFTALYFKESVGSVVAGSFLTLDEYQQAWDSNTAAGRNLTYLSACQYAGEVRISAIFQQNAPGTGGVVAHHNLTPEQLTNELNTRIDQGYLTTVLAGYSVGGKATFAGAWRKP